MRKTLANWENALTAESTENTEGMGEVALGKNLLVVLPGLRGLHGQSRPLVFALIDLRVLGALRGRSGLRLYPPQRRNGRSTLLFETLWPALYSPRRDGRYVQAGNRGRAQSL